MPTPADSPLRKVTLNLYEDDCNELRKAYGHGWSTELRSIVNIHVTTFIRSLRSSRSKTLGDLNGQ